MKRRNAFTLIEMTIFGFMAIILVIIIMSLLSSAWKGDEHTAGRLDGARTMSVLLAGLRSDSWRAHWSKAESSSSLVFENPDDAEKSMRYRWTGPKTGMVRGADPIGGVAPAEFKVVDIPECTLIELSIVPGGPGEAKPIKFTIPVVVPGARARNRFPEWAPSP